MEYYHFKLMATGRIVLLALILVGTGLKSNGFGQAAIPQAEIALRQYVGPLKSIQVAVGGGMLPFIFDTGGGFTIITPEVAQKTGCVPFGRLTGFRHNGERLEVQRCSKTPLGLGGMNVTVEAAVFDLMAVLRQSGDLPLVGGLMALNMFEKVPITLDYANEKLIIESPASLKDRINGMKPLSVRLSRQAGGAAIDLFVEVEAKTGTIWLELDSGNNGPVLLSKHAVSQLGLDTAQNNLSVTLNIIGLGPVKTEAVVRDTIYDGLLNAKFLEETVLTLDLSAAKAWAKLRIN
jgi:predicted aspartyl protease